eukprot:c20581_g1_i1.p1 GENE.c20581_g1_i1~~c20581_g1_i1.p1  ORF type:complete len:318 (+),score=58.27 c20581_g1_i1:559-1512(+)
MLQFVCLSIMCVMCVSETPLDRAARLSLKRCLESCLSLTALSITAGVDSDDDGQWLLESLASLTHVTKLSLQVNRLGPGGSRRLSGALCGMANMKQLYIHHNQMDAASDLAQALTHMPLLTALNLYYNHLGCEGARCVGNVLGLMPHLTALSLDGNRLGSAGVEWLCPALPPSLLLLSLASNQVGSDGAQHLAQALHHTPHLTSLNLSANALTHEGIVHLAPVLGSLHHVTSLELPLNKIGEGILVLAAALEHMPRMKTLNLCNNGLPHSGAQALVKAVAHMPLLAHLLLSGNQFDETDFTQLFPGRVTPKHMMPGI